MDSRVQRRRNALHLAILTIEGSVRLQDDRSVG